jgi:hypothetical protein
VSPLIFRPDLERNRKLRLSTSCGPTADFSLLKRRLYAISAEYRVTRFTVIKGRSAERHKESLRSLEFFPEIPFDCTESITIPAETDVWYLLDVVQCVTAAFLDHNRTCLPHTPTTLIHVFIVRAGVFYTGSFKVITFKWKRSKNLVGTQQILFDFLCDLVIRSCGIFSDFPHPSYIVEMLPDFVGKMVEGHGRLHPHINEENKGIG